MAKKRRQSRDFLEYIVYFPCIPAGGRDANASRLRRSETYPPTPSRARGTEEDRRPAAGETAFQHRRMFC